MTLTYISDCLADIMPPPDRTTLNSVSAVSLPHMHARSHAHIHTCIYLKLTFFCSGIHRDYNCVRDRDWDPWCLLSLCMFESVTFSICTYM